MIEFFDTSALVKHYVREPGSAAVRTALRRKTPVVARIAHAELASALARLCREGSLDARARDRLLARIDADFATFDVVELRPAVSRMAAALVCRHPLRALDALQLASALALGRPTVRFWCADERLVAAASAEGLRTTTPS